MKPRACLPSAGWTALVLMSFGTGAAVAYVGDSPVQLAAAPRVPVPGELDVGHCVVLAAAGQSLAPEDMKAYEEAQPPLWDNLGSLSYPISTKSADAQKYFDQGLRLAVNFNHAEARRAFRKAQSLDPDCAMC
ncbi:MAG: hypothetical protein E5Y81_17755, partial [Mesorhizobium sp.]